MTEIEKLEVKLSKAKFLAKEKTKQKKTLLYDTVIGKCFKSYDNSRSTTDASYVRIVGRMKYGDSLVCEDVDIHLSITGYFLYYGELRKETKSVGGRLPIKKHYDNNVAIEPRAMHHFSYIKPTKYDNKTGMLQSDRTFKYYQECSEVEFDLARSKILELNTYAHTLFAPLNIDTKRFEKAYDVINISYTDLTIISEFLETFKDKKLTLRDVKTAAYKNHTFNVYNGTKLTELVQYSKEGDVDKGLNLTVVSGDDGSDYEPYVTKYILEFVDIDWKQVLYPIRNSLDSVISTAEDLSKLLDIYNVDNWTLNYFGSYDVTFESAVLNKICLNQINSVIKTHLK